MKKKFVIICAIILFCIVGLIINVTSHKKLNKEDALELMNRVEDYKNVYIKTSIEDESKDITKIDFFKYNDLELYRIKTKNNERIEWADNTQNKTIIINEEEKTYKILDNYKKQNNYNDLKYKYKFIEYEKYNNVKCAVVEFSYENISRDTIWIDLETGIILKKVGVVNMYKYKQYSEVSFNSVTNENVMQPDVLDYTHVENFEQVEIDSIPKYNF